MTTNGTILLVEDDESLRLALRDNLEERGYRVLDAATARRASELEALQAFDLAILDVMLPDGDGYALCRRWRSRHPDARILLLTARTLEDDAVRGFEAGADDYVTKPYRLRELLARVVALLRRSAATPDRLLFAGFTLDLTARQLANAAGVAIDLTRTEFDLLEFLVRHRDRALTRDQILDAVWGANVVVDARTVDNFVLSLKRKLAWTEGSAFRIKAIRGVGYRLEVDEPAAASAGGTLG